MNEKLLQSVGNALLLVFFGYVIIVFFVLVKGVPEAIGWALVITLFVIIVSMLVSLHLLEKREVLKMKTLFCPECLEIYERYEKGEL